MAVERIGEAVNFAPFVVPGAWYSGAASRAVMVLLPALGTPASVYQSFAEAAVGRGIDVLLPELPGTGESRPRPRRGIDYGYRDLVERYLPPLVERARSRASGRPVVLAGHSLGAQLAALAVIHRKVRPDAVLSLAGGHIHFRNWDGIDRVRVYGAALLAMTLSTAFGYLPGRRFGFGGPQAATLMRDWSRTIRHGRFPEIEGGSAGANHPPALALAYEGDFFNPPRSAAALAKLLGGESRVLPMGWPGRPHSSWARHPEATLDATGHWLARRGVLES